MLSVVLLIEVNNTNFQSTVGKKRCSSDSELEPIVWYRSIKSIHKESEMDDKEFDFIGKPFLHPVLAAGLPSPRCSIEKMNDQ